MSHNVTAVLVTGDVVGADDVEFNFDADNQVVYLVADSGKITYLNFKYVVQFGAVPV